MRWHIFRWLYSFLMMLLLPFIFLRLWIRGFKLPAYRLRWAERLGFAPFPPLEQVVWIHAVSVGEVISAIPLINQLLAKKPDLKILVTTTTPTGSDRVQKAFNDMLGKRVYHCYLPYDFPFAFQPFFSRVKAEQLIIMETELWPNLLYQCERRNIDITIINGRLSPLSVKRYSLLGQLMQQMVQPIKQVATQSALDQANFIRVGFDAARVVNTGNIKYDFELPVYLSQEGKKLRHEIGNNRIVWIAASTHEGEEIMALQVFQSLKKHYNDLLLFLVPRHPDRFESVAELCQSQGMRMARRSKKELVSTDTDVYLGDTMGELPLFYAASDIAFVGGSLMPIGGHNLLEPAALGLPVLTGPHLFNFVEISDNLVKAGGAQIVANALELEIALKRLITNPEQRFKIGEQGKQVVQNNKGALERVLNLLIPKLIACHNIIDFK